MVKMRRKYYVVYLAIITVLFVIFQVWLITVYFKPYETRPGFHSDPFPNFTLIPGTVLLTVEWLYLLYQIRREGRQAA